MFKNVVINSKNINTASETKPYINYWAMGPPGYSHEGDLWLVEVAGDHLVGLSEFGLVVSA